MQTWTQKIRALEESGWSLASIARKVGLSQQAIGDLKHGRTKEPTGMAAVRLHALSKRTTNSAASKRAASVSALKPTANHKTS